MMRRRERTSFSFVVSSVGLYVSTRLGLLLSLLLLLLHKYSLLFSLSSVFSSLLSLTIEEICGVEIGLLENATRDAVCQLLRFEELHVLLHISWFAYKRGGKLQNQAKKKR